MGSSRETNLFAALPCCVVTLKFASCNAKLRMINIVYNPSLLNEASPAPDRIYTPLLVPYG
jgi:hypothetical protein